MRFLKIGLSAAAIGLLSAGAAANPARTDNAARQTVHMELVFLWRKLPVWRLVLDVRLDGDRYAVKATSRAIGAVWAVTKSISTSTVAGRVAGGRLLPKRYVLNGSFRDRKRQVTLSYPEPGRTVLSVSPPDALKDWTKVPQQLRQETVDPLTALAAALSVDGAAPCALRRDIYDGHRRYRITAERAGEDKLERSLWNRYSGAATRCTLRSKTLAGWHEKSDAAKALAAGKPVPPTPPGTVWIARIPGTGIQMPVKMFVDTRWGEVRGELFKYRVTTE